MKVVERERRVKPSKRQSRRKRRLRFAAAAALATRDEHERGVGPSIAQSGDYHMARAAGFDPLSREMRRREPPTRSSNGAGSRLNRKNGWHMAGDAKTLVSPKEGAPWLWWLSLGDDAQDEVYELSMKCGDKGDGISHADADPMELLKAMADVSEETAKSARYVAIGAEDARGWGRKR